MDRNEAISYLQRKKKVRKDIKIIEEKPVRKIIQKVKKVIYYKRPLFDRREEKEIKEVMKEGKIYGDPLALIK